MSDSARSSGAAAPDGGATNDEIEPVSNDTTSLTSEERRIVVGVEGSPCAFRALEYAANQAASTGSILQIVTVYTGLPGYGPFTPVVLDHDGAESVVSAAIDEVHKSYPGVVTKGEIVHGETGPVLSDVSEGASRSWWEPGDTGRSSGPSSVQSRNTWSITRTARPPLSAEPIVPAPPPCRHGHPTYGRMSSSPA